MSLQLFLYLLKATLSIEQAKTWLFSGGAIVCFFIWLIALLGLVDLGLLWVWVFFVLLLLALAKVWSSVVLVAVLMLLWGVWWCLFIFPCHMCFLFVFTLPPVPLLPSCPCVPLGLCLSWCLSQLPSSSLSPFSTPPTPSPANGPPSPKFGRDPLSYCLKEINKTVKPRISSFRTLKRTVSVTCQGSSNFATPVCCCFWHVSLRRSAALDWSGSE